MFFYLLTCKKIYIMNKYEVTRKVRSKLNHDTQEEICKKIGITRPTLSVRLKNNDWKVSEIYLIQTKL